jgi:hypothetical protein
MGESRPAVSVTRTSAKLRLPFRGLIRQIDRAFVGPTLPCSTFALSSRALQVFSFYRRVKVFTPRLRLSASYPSPRSTTTSPPPPHARVRAPLLQFRPLQRSTEAGARITRRFQPPALSVLRVSRPLDVLLRLQPSRAYFIPLTLLGFHRVRPLAQAFQPVQGESLPGFLFKTFSLPVTTASSAVSALAYRRGPRPRGTSVISLPAKGTKPPDGRCRVSIAKSSVYPKEAIQGHQPS